MVFPVSGVEVSPFVPPMVAFLVSLVCSTGGLSGAFLLLPFQISILHFTSPSVSATNLVFNLLAIPSGVYTYLSEGRMVWPLAWVIILGSLPGFLLGVLVRVTCLPAPKAFGLFVGIVLLAIGARLWFDLLPRARTNQPQEDRKENPARPGERTARLADRFSSEDRVRMTRFSLWEMEYAFYGESFVFNVPAVFILALAVGVIGGIYGIGGGAILAPVLVSYFDLPVYTVAGAALLGTFLTSLAGIFFYEFMDTVSFASGFSSAPDWGLGALFGLGGFLGMYCGARAQKFIPSRIIKGVLGGIVLLISVQYILRYWF